VVVELSVVMPVYNERAVIEQVLREHRAVLDERLPTEAGEIVVVDDGSTDGTSGMLDQLVDEIAGLVVLHQPANAGPGPAVHRAFEAARGEWVLHVDADGQTDAHDLWRLWDRRDEADLLLGVRRVRRDPRHRLVLTAVTRVVVTILAGRRIQDANVPFKLFRRALWADLRPVIGPTTFTPSLLVAVGAARRGWRVLEIDVTHRARPAGRSTFRMGRLAGAVLAAGRQAVLFRVRVDRLPPRQSEGR
jgi:glycosyltransferase involved in cell wall biosynthesis